MDEQRGVADGHRLQVPRRLRTSSSAAPRPPRLDAKVWTAVYGDDHLQPADTWGSLQEVTTATGDDRRELPIAGGRVPAALAPVLRREVHGHGRLRAAAGVDDEQPQRLRRGALARALRPRLRGRLRRREHHGGRTALALDSRRRLVGAGRRAGATSTSPPTSSTREVVLDEREGRARIVLRNDPVDGATSGRYSAYGTGALSAIQRGARLQLSAGYHTSDGDEVSSGPAYWVESIDQMTGSRPSLIVNARDALVGARAWRARRQFFWPAGTRSVASLLDYICSRAGLNYTAITTSASLGGVLPAFTIHPGEDGKTAVRRLLALVPDEAIARGGMIASVYPDPADTPVYDYGTGHAIVAARYRDRGPALNRARVVGAGVFTEAFAFAESDSCRRAHRPRLGPRSHDVSAGGRPRIGRAAARRASRSRRRANRLRRELRARSCTTSSRSRTLRPDSTSAPRRVLGLSWRYSTGTQRARSRYDMTLRLGNPESEAPT